MSNAYENGEQKMIPAVLVYISRMHGGKREFLMLHRVTRQSDFHFEKWNGLGGKMNALETPYEAAVREVREEAEIELKIEDLELLGNINFPNFKPSKREDWLCYVFTADISNKKLIAQEVLSDEGELHWVEEKNILSLPLWPGDVLFLPYVFKRQRFLGGIHYDDGKVKKHWFTI